MNRLGILVLAAALSGCATLTNDATVPVALSFSNGESGQCELENKRWGQDARIPAQLNVRRSDDDLRYDCVTESGKTAKGRIPSTVGAKIVASAVFIDFGITDAITDKHRIYPPSFVIPVEGS